MVDASSLYPQPPAPQHQLSLPQMLSTIGQINELRLFQARQAVGNVYGNALNPDGTTDDAKLSAGLKDPAASLLAPEAIGTMLSQRQQQIQNQSGQFALDAGQTRFVQDQLSGLATKPDLSQNDVMNAIVNIARQTNIPSNKLTSWMQNVPTGQKAIRDYIVNFQNTSMGAGAAAQRITGPPDITGAPTEQPLGSAGYSGRYPVTLPPGQKEALANDQQMFFNAQQNAGTTLASLRPLQIALPLAEQLGHTSFGPGSADLAKIQAALKFAGIDVPPGSDDPATRQELGKYLLTYARQPRAADRSDESLRTFISSNPNPDQMVQPATIALIKNQAAMDRMDAAIPVAFGNQYGQPSRVNKFNDFRANSYQNLDMRAFQIDLMTSEQRADLKKSLGGKDSPAWKKFVQSYQLAKEAGVLSPPQSQ